jgi:hypothetical protein
MPNPRTPAPSRIGKTLGAILSAPRRGTADVDEPDEVAEAAAQPDRAGDDAPGTDTAASPSTPAGTAPGRAARPSPANDPTTAAVASAAAIEPPASVSGAAVPPGAAVDVDPADAPDAGGGTRRKKRETFLIPEELADAMRNAIVHLSGPPLYYTLAEFGEHAIRNYIAQLEREHNAGRPFPPRPRAVRQGRPLR